MSGAALAAVARHVSSTMSRAGGIVFVTDMTHPQTGCLFKAITVQVFAVDISDTTCKSILCPCQAWLLSRLKTRSCMQTFGICDL